MILLRPICWIWGHRRGKAVDGQVGVFRCPRCGRETRYKVKPDAPSVGQPTDSSPSISVAQANAEYLAKRKP